MSDQVRLGEWNIRFGPDQSPVVCTRESSEDVATVHGDFDVALRRAMLIARAPSLRDAVRAAAKVFATMKQFGNEREREVGADMLPSMEAALYGLGDPEEDGTPTA